MLAGFECPSDTPTAGTHVDPAYCVRDCPHKCMPSAVLSAIWEENRTNEHRGNMISPSALKGCARSLVLQRTTPYYQNPRQLFMSVRGSIIHGFLEKPNIHGVITEQRLYKRVDGDVPFVLSGRFDYYDTIVRSLADYKTTADRGLYYVLNTGAKPDHVWQTNVYRWLMHGGHLDGVDGPVVDYPTDNITIHYITMSRVVSTGTRVTERVLDRDRPRKPPGTMVSCEKDGFDRYGRQMYQLVYEIPPVPVKPFDEIEAYVRERGPIYQKAFEDGPEAAPHVLGKPNEMWQCDWCGPRDRCHAIAKQAPEQLTLQLHVSDTYEV